MNNQDIFATFVITLILGLIVVALCSASNQIETLEKEKNELQQEITEYKWQLEQVPYIIESWCNGE